MKINLKKIFGIKSPYKVYSITHNDTLVYVVRSNKKYVTIRDITMFGSTNKSPILFDLESALKVKRFMNHYYKGSTNIVDWKVFYRMKKKLDINKGGYSISFKKYGNEILHESKSEFRNRRLNTILNK